MIEGFKLDFPSEELKAHLERRRDHHGEKEASYRQQAEGVRAVQGDDFQGQTMDPKHALDHSASTHAAKKEYFGLMADHVIPSEVYRLSQNDLVLLELVSRGW